LPELTTSRQTTFSVRLGIAYYYHGIINPGVDASHYLGNDGDPVIVYLGSEAEQVDSVINRSANPNGSVRIVGNNRRIAEWFQQHYKFGETVEAKVRDPQHILLMMPTE
jgi:hypothetical protein